LSIVIPIKITFSNRFLLSRVRQQIQEFSTFREIEIIIVDSSPKMRYSNALASCCNFKSISYHYLSMKSIYSVAKARNYGAKEARGDYLLFYDVDLIVKDNFIEKVLEDSKRFVMNSFTIYPCLYLSEAQTKIIEGKVLANHVFEEIKERYLEGFNDEVLYLAVNTSTILVRREHFFNIGAYDEYYQGHGYEDFELIHRLYIAYPIVERKADYILDYKTNFPGEYKGFRKYFSYYALPNFFEGKYTLHLWHSRPLLRKYYRTRKNNAKYFLKQLKESLSIKLPLNDVDLNLSNKMDLYIKQQSMKSKFNNTIGLFELNKESLKSKKRGTFKQKFRKLVLEPKQFFLDAQFLKR